MEFELTPVSSRQKQIREAVLKTNYVLVNFEYVQPNNVELLKGHGFKVIFLSIIKR